MPPKKTILIMLLTLLPGLVCADGAPTLPADLQQEASECIGAIYRNSFKSAEDVARKIIKKYPDHPAGYFFYAVALKAWMDYYKTNRRENDFYTCCDQAIDKGEKMQDKGRGGGWVAFFTGGAEGYKGTYEADNERWITAFRHGWKGISILEDLYKAEPTLQDCCFGLGKYDYWRSALSKMLWWMPHVADRRAEGIQKLYAAMQGGAFTREAAAEELVRILCREGRYAEGLKICDTFLEKYPASLFFLWGKAGALWGLQRYEEAEKTYRAVLSGVEAENLDNHCAAIICNYWLAKIYRQTGRAVQCVAECNRMEFYKISEEVAPRVKDYLSKAAQLRKEAAAMERP
ncbi:MAG: hypothetical protein PHC61_03815 [Chitinivibrionales bacterium]|nr:hypothetical protein [Chitinivibrionales bacterium]